MTDDEVQAGSRWAPALRALGDERLARMVESGSETAFAAIYGRYAPVLHGYCRSLLRDEEEAGDALQNAMLKALQAMRRAGRTGPLRPWLFRIAHNESISIRRARTRRPEPLEESMVAGADDAFRRAVAREQLAALLADMENLTEHQRGALVMRELGGLSYDEISQALDTTPLAARQAVFVARKRLSNGPIAPKRLRPALRQLIPAPAGAALWGWLGGGSVSIAGKALIGTAAAVSVGVGSLELATEPPVKPAHKVVAAAPAPKTASRRHHRRAAPAATPTAVARTAARVRQPTPSVAVAPSATFVRVADHTAATPVSTPHAADPTPAPRRPVHRDPPPRRDDDRQVPPPPSPTVEHEPEQSTPPPVEHYESTTETSGSGGPEGPDPGSGGGPGPSAPGSDGTSGDSGTVQ